ncbi:hypothetical protein JVU11DRAFT_3763 [Chiua virens]|nr:hypothetical protein JVU11DRAFT_3763 [Chiua virens]
MSARQAFQPRPASCTPSSEPHPHSTDTRARDGDTEMFGKARSVTAFLGQKRATGTSITSQGGRANQEPGLGRANASSNRRSFDGIARPVMAPISIIPYPETPSQLCSGVTRRGVAQTPRKTLGPTAFEFMRPMTPVSVSRGTKKGFGSFPESQDDEMTACGSMDAKSVGLMRPDGDENVQCGAETGLGGYMRALEASERSGSRPVPSLEHEIVAPVPGYTLRGLSTHTHNNGPEVEGMFPTCRKSLDLASEKETDMERNDDLQLEMGHGRLKRGLRSEDGQKHGNFTDEDHRSPGSAKRARQARQDPDEYLRISSPPMPPTPALRTTSVGVVDPSREMDLMFENIGEFVSFEEVEADWKRWRDCTREEWLKGVDEIAQVYTDILNMVKDRLTDYVLALGNMMSPVEERRREVDRNMELIHAKENIVRENILQLGKKK